MKKCIQFQQFDLKRWKELKEMRLGREQKIDTTSKRHKFTLTDQRVARLNSEENQSQGPKIGTKNREPQVRNWEYESEAQVWYCMSKNERVSGIYRLSSDELMRQLTLESRLWLCGGEKAEEWSTWGLSGWPTNSEIERNRGRRVEDREGRLERV